ARWCVPTGWRLPGSGSPGCCCTGWPARSRLHPARAPARWAGSARVPPAKRRAPGAWTEHSLKGLVLHGGGHREPVLAAGAREQRHQEGREWTQGRIHLDDDQLFGAVAVVARQRDYLAGRIDGLEHGDRIGAVVHAHRRLSDPLAGSGATVAGGGRQAALSGDRVTGALTHRVLHRQVRKEQVALVDDREE